VITNPIDQFTMRSNQKMWNTKSRVGAVAVVAFALTAMGCSKDQGQAGAIAGPASATAALVGPTYIQIEELGNPLVSEVTILKARHDVYDRTQPYNTATFRPETEAFIRNVAGRPADYAATIGGVLYPDILIVDSSKDPRTAGWLSWFDNGWGGRELRDDVVDIALYAVFSSILSPVGASCAPGQLPLCTDNVNGNDVPNLATFPYVARPSL